jgi:anthranilate/para-aminobenzoate synthase component I
MVEKVATIRGLRVDVPPDAVLLASRVASLGGVSALISGAPRATGPWRSFVAALPVEHVRTLAPPGGVGGTGVTAPFGDVPRWVGIAPYEAGRGIERAAWSRVDSRPAPHHVLPTWVRYGAVLSIDHRTGEVLCVGDDPACVRELARAASVDVARVEASVRLVREEPPERHAERIREALSRIAAGHLYQVNLARRLDLEVRGDALSILRRMMRSSRSSHGSYIAFHGEPSVVSTSPELFLCVRPDGRVVTEPIKGTRPRGGDAASDRDLARALDADPKERAELAMVIDLERNDLGRLARVGSVRLVDEPHVVTLAPLHHRVATVAARLPAGTTWEHLLAATFPSGSVTGAPKVRAMETIADLEETRRGLYTGAIGHVSLDGTLTLAMAIRTLTIAGEEGHWHAGGGIVAGSDPDREVEETRVKSRQVVALLGA